ARETGIAIAWDESLREPDFAFVAEEGVRAVVIKPTLTGSLEKVREQVQAAIRASCVKPKLDSMEELITAVSP
ncbi:hypothetical protein ACUOFC_67490, partial [Escherichia sp. TWPC-MK]